ncbi:MAG TPA: FAD-linked oxidase C-terminal domain-containing protein [Trueperaceae bacterium]|nr:FAD-linked oxidase C-terminal domain-containing protein [Trueperaceae bacterium]
MIALPTGLLREDQIVTTPAVLEQHGRGESFSETVLPDAVLYPESAEEVAAVVGFAVERGIPVTPVGANSSLEGHTVPLAGGLSLDMTRMDRILELRPADFLTVVQPGVQYRAVNERARHSGVFFPIDPGAHATLGGMVSTNASGTMAVRYGVTGDYVLGLQVVTPTGEVLRVGNRARKSASGYDLCALFTGAEGTLGVITEITLRLVGLPEAASAARVPFGDAAAATAFVTRLIQAGVPVARCELVDPRSIAAVNDYAGTAYPEEMTVFLEFHGNPAGIAADAELARDLAGEAGALGFEAAAGAAARERLWDARHKAFYAYVAANPGKRNLVTDVAVPISRLPQAVTGALADCAALGIPAYLIGHVGDGNFHLALFYGESAEERQRVDDAAHAVVRRALALGGTCTGEHGIGARKLRYLAEEHGDALRLMQLLKRTLDPAGIMNPGKKVPA